MKNRIYEQLGRRMRDFHRVHSWQLDRDGLYIPHRFEHMGPQNLAWWDDVGFILNGKRVIVWWRHPRAVYCEVIADRARESLGISPPFSRLKSNAIKNYRLVGKTGRRKRLVSYTYGPRSEVQVQYDQRLWDMETRLTTEGIDVKVLASWKWKRLSWAMSLTLVTPIEVLRRQDLAAVAVLARHLINGQTTLSSEFPGYSYGKADWLRDQAALSFAKQVGVKDAVQ